MDSLEKLRQIGIKKINQETRISISVLENILEKRFEKIQRVWIVGFLPIIERQYDVDLTKWLEEYDAYYAENSATHLNNIYRIKELKLDTQDYAQKPQSILSKSNLKYLIGILVIVLVVFGFIIIHKIFSQSQNTSIDYKAVDESGKVVNENINPKTDISKKSTSLNQNEGIYSQLNLQNVPTKTNSETSFMPDLPSPKEGEVMITPKGELWFQVLNPKTQEKQDRTIREAYIMPVPEEGTLIIFGHKGFSIAYKDGSKKYDGGGPIRFIIENGRLKYIKYSDYVKKLNQFSPKSDTSDAEASDLKNETPSTNEQTQDDTSSQDTQDLEEN